MRNFLDTQETTSPKPIQSVAAMHVVGVTAKLQFRLENPWLKPAAEQYSLRTTQPGNQGESLLSFILFLLTNLFEVREGLDSQQLDLKVLIRL